MLYTVLLITSFLRDCDKTGYLYKVLDTQPGTSIIPQMTSWSCPLEIQMDMQGPILPWYNMQTKLVLTGNNITSGMQLGHASQLALKFWKTWTWGAPLRRIPISLQLETVNNNFQACLSPLAVMKNVWFTVPASVLCQNQLVCGTRGSWRFESLACSPWQQGSSRNWWALQAMLPAMFRPMHSMVDNSKTLQNAAWELESSRLCQVMGSWGGIGAGKESSIIVNYSYIRDWWKRKF